MAARAGRRDGVGSNEYGLGSGVNAGRRAGSRWKSGREASASGEADVRRELTPCGREVGMLASVALAKLALHHVLSGRYGYWIDELYFLACGDHLAWGYVDMPPLTAAVAKASRLLLGDSLLAIRLLPAVSGALLVFLAGRVARELGGGRFAQLAAAVAVLVAPVYLALQGVLTMNAFQPRFWMTSVWVDIRMVRLEGAGFVRLTG